jgi:hypothetical protein
MEKFLKYAPYAIITAVLLFFIFVNSANAAGSITAQANVYDQKVVRPAIGLEIYEPLMKKVAFNSFTGIGMQPLILSDDVTWFVTKNQLDYYHRDWTFSPGLEIKYVLPYHESRTNMFLKVEKRLW